MGIIEKKKTKKDEKDEDTSKKGKKKLTRSLHLVFLRQYAAESLIKGNRVTLKTELERKGKLKRGKRRKKPARQHSR